MEPTRSIISPVLPAGLGLVWDVIVFIAETCFEILHAGPQLHDFRQTPFAVFVMLGLKDTLQPSGVGLGALGADRILGLSIPHPVVTPIGLRSIIHEFRLVLADALLE